MEEHLAELVCGLDAGWKRIAERLQEAGPAAKVSVSIEVQDDGRTKLTVDKLGALGEPKSLTWLRKRVEKMLPKIDLPDLLVKAAPSPKYFGFKRGITWLDAVNDQVAGIGQMVDPGTPCDSHRHGVRPVHALTGDRASAAGGRAGRWHLPAADEPAARRARPGPQRHWPLDDDVHRRRHRPTPRRLQRARDEDIARLSPLKHRNLNLLGRDGFTAGVPAAGALRPLRDPGGPELDEDDGGEE